MKSKNQVSFALGTGRCGTNFIYELFNKSKSCTAFHEQNPLNDAFIRYVTWYQLQVDLKASWDQKDIAITKVLQDGKSYFESSAYLSLSIPELSKNYNAKFIFLIRHPKAVVKSYHAKGWYQQTVLRANPAWPPSIPAGLKFPHHAFSRIIAYGKEGPKWEELSRVGQLAWFWKTINTAILAALGSLSEEQYKIVRLEDFDYEKYQEISSFLNLDSPLSERRFTRIASSKPNKSKHKQVLKNWSEKEEEEYQFYVADLAGRFNYEV